MYWRRSQHQSRSSSFLSCPLKTHSNAQFCLNEHQQSIDHTYRDVVMEKKKQRLRQRFWISAVTLPPPQLTRWDQIRKSASPLEGSHPASCLDIQPVFGDHADDQEEASDPLSCSWMWSITPHHPLPKQQQLTKPDQEDQEEEVQVQLVKGSCKTTYNWVALVCIQLEVEEANEEEATRHTDYGAEAWMREGLRERRREQEGERGWELEWGREREKGRWVSHNEEEQRWWKRKWEGEELQWY